MSLRDTASSFKFDVSSAHETAHRRIGRGGAPVRVWQGVGPPRGGCGRGAPKGVWGGAREANAFFCVENPQKYVKAALKM